MLAARQLYFDYDGRPALRGVSVEADPGSILGVIGPLLIWLIKKDDHPFIDDQGKESLNFQITILIAVLVCGVLLCAGIGFVLLPIVAIYNIVFIIIAAIKANEGEDFRYPITLRLFK